MCPVKIFNSSMDLGCKCIVQNLKMATQSKDDRQKEYESSYIYEYIKLQ